MKIFVTGATGFIGCRVAERLTHAGHELRCLVRGSSDATHLEELGATTIVGDLLDEASLRAGMGGCDAAIDVAAAYAFWHRDASTFEAVNVRGTRNVMVAALDAGVSKVVHVSTLAVYGKPTDSPFTEDSTPGEQVFSEYARTKREGDRFAWGLHERQHLPLVMIYPGGVLGARDPNATGEYIRRLVRRRMPATVFDDVVFPWVHVRDVAALIVSAVEVDGNVGERYFAVGENLTFAQFNRTIGELSGVRIPPLHLPDTMVMASAAVLTSLANVTGRPPLLGLSTEQMRTMRVGGRADGGKAERELGIAYTPIRTALEEEIASLSGR
jgi:dihydroflavonol-4-reductase